MKKKEESKFKRKYKPLNYNPIRPLNYEKTEFKNVIGKDNPSIAEMFCYDAPLHHGSRHVLSRRKHSW